MCRLYMNAISRYQNENQNHCKKLTDHDMNELGLKWGDDNYCDKSSYEKNQRYE